MTENKQKIIVIFLLLAFSAAFFPANAFAEAKNYGEADLGCGLKDQSGKCLGPEISIGLWSYSKKDFKENRFKIKANKSFTVKDKDRETLLTIPAGETVKIKYLSEEKLRIYGDNIVEQKVNPKKIYFEAEKDGDRPEIIFDVNKPGSGFDKYRGKMAIRLYDTKGNDNDRFWIINYLPLEQYVWGMGEITGTGHVNHNRVMTTVFRTYGYWKTKFSTKYAHYGFIVDGTSRSQIYYGYDWEKEYPRIKEAAEDTRGKLAIYKKEIAITPYCSWTDGKTRNFPDGHWGGTCKKKITGKISSYYPWIIGVKDFYGKNKKSNTCDLAKAGNHMVGLSAHGSLNLAEKYKWKWDKILKYYFKKINIYGAYN